MARLPPQCPNGDPCIGTSCQRNPRACRQGDIARFAETLTWDDTGLPFWVGRQRRPHQAWIANGIVYLPEPTPEDRAYLEKLWRKSRAPADLSKILIG